MTVLFIPLAGVKLKALRGRRRKARLAPEPTLATPKDPPAFRFRDALARIDERERRRLEEGRRNRAAKLAVASRDTVTLMADDANEKVRRVRVMDAIERAFRKDHITEEQYRLARCLELDVARLGAQGGGGRFVLYRDATAEDGAAFALMPSAPRGRAATAHLDALDALARVEAAIGPGPAYAVLRAWAGEGFALYELDARWRRRRGWALAMVQFALSRMADAQVYEREKWRIDVLAEAA